MIRDLSEPGVLDALAPADHDADLVVVGTGPAAAVVVSELLEAGCTARILVLESGRRRPWAFADRLRHTRHAGIRIKPHSRERCLGGASTTWSGLSSPMDPIELADMLAEIDNGADFVAPWRHPRVDPLLNQLQSVLFNLVIRTIIGMRFHDLNCYFRAIRREVLEDVVIYGDMYRFLPVIAFRRGYRVVEVKVRHLQEWGRAGFFGLGVYIRRVLDILAVMFLTKFTLKPLRFFGTLGGLVTLCGAALAAFLAFERVVYDKGVTGNPVLLIAVLLLVLGVQIIGFGLVGEIIIYSQARNLKEYRIERIWE